MSRQNVQTYFPFYSLPVAYRARQNLFFSLFLCLINLPILLSGSPILLPLSLIVPAVIKVQVKQGVPGSLLQNVVVQSSEKNRYRPLFL